MFSFFGLKKSRFACRRIYFDRQQTLAAIEFHDFKPFISLDFFKKMSVQNKPKALKYLIAKKPELGPSKRWKSQELLWLTTWASRSSLKSRCIADPSASMPRRIIGIIKNGGDLHYEFI